MQLFDVTGNHAAVSRAQVKFPVFLVLVSPHQASGQANGHNRPADAL